MNSNNESLKRILKKYNLKAKKRFGQNFLHDKNIINQIVKSSSCDERFIVEVGPGPGLLTNAILEKKIKKVLAIETDKTFLPILEELKEKHPKKFEFIIQTYPNTDYAIDSRFKLDLITDQLAAKEMSIARFYMKTQKWIPALNRLKVVTEKYEKTVFVEEALHRLVEVYYRLGLVDEAKKAAAILGYNYQSGDWYKRSYKVFNKKYNSRKIKKEKKMGLIKRKIKSLLE